MRTVKISCMIALLCFSVVVGLSAGAWSQDRAERYTNKRVKAIGAEINLTLVQMDSVKEVMLSSVRSMLQAASGERRNVEERSAILHQMAGLVEERHAGIKDVLTDEQWSAYTGKGVERAAEIRTEILTAYLLLAEGQIFEIYKINKKTAERIAAFSPQAEDGTKPKQRRGKRSIETLKLSRDEAYKGIMTSDQWEEYEAVRESIAEIFGD